VLARASPIVSRVGCTGGACVAFRVSGALLEHQADHFLQSPIRIKAEGRS
jgi:hypothetical protein